jgi:dihydroorotate dehydrogenase (fumarate)
MAENSHYEAGGVRFPFAPVMVGAGVCKTPDEASKWLNVAPVVSGSYTPKQRNVNEGKVFFPETEEAFLQAGSGVNSFGMPNMGIPKAAEKLAFYNGPNPLIVSIAGFDIADYHKGFMALKNCRSVTAVECNFGCPNTEHGRIMSFDLESLNTLLMELSVVGDAIPIWVKFSPYSDPGMLAEVAAIVNMYKSVIKAVVTCNTFPNAFMGAGNISPNNGLAGLSGPAMKPIALGQVVQFRQHLDDDVDVIGVGGATTGNDIVDFFDAGAKGVQLTSMPFWSGNPGEFWERLLNEERGGERLVQFLNSDM